MKKFEMDIAALEADMETRSEAGLSFNKWEADMAIRSEAELSFNKWED